jgi:hypothetical protein
MMTHTICVAFWQQINVPSMKELELNLTFISSHFTTPVEHEISIQLSKHVSFHQDFNAIFPSEIIKAMMM